MNPMPARHGMTAVNCYIYKENKLIKSAADLSLQVTGTNWDQDYVGV